MFRFSGGVGHLFVDLLPCELAYVLPDAGDLGPAGCVRVPDCAGNLCWVRQRLRRYGGIGVPLAGSVPRPPEPPVALCRLCGWRQSVGAVGVVNVVGSGCLCSFRGFCDLGSAFGTSFVPPVASVVGRDVAKRTFVGVAAAFCRRYRGKH